MGRTFFLASLLGLAACANVFDLETVTAVPGDAGGDGVSTTCFVETFDTIDSAVWSDYTASGTSLVADGQLVITPAASAEGETYASLMTVERDLTGYSTEVEVVTPPADLGFEVIVHWVVDANNYYGLYVNGPQLELGVTVDNDHVYEVINYSPLTHRFVKMEHDAFNKKVLFSTRSVDAGAWVMRHSVDAHLSLENLTFEVGAGTYVPVENPGVARLDNARICPP